MILGVDGCRGGWVGAVLRGRAGELVHGSTFAAVVAAAEELGRLAVIGVDMPVGLPASGSREADRLARKALGRKGSSVFTTAVREAYLAPSHAEATAINAARTGSGLSVQGWRLGPKVLELDAWVRATGRQVVEVHPELSFARLAGAPVLAGKRTAEGRERRAELLAAQGLWPLRDRHGVARLAAPDDLLDAVAVVWTARRYAEGRATCLPDSPEVVADGVRAAIWT